jgi:hypothetical protein
MVIYSGLLTSEFMARSNSSGIAALILGKCEKPVNEGTAAMRLFNGDIVGFLIVVPQLGQSMRLVSHHGSHRLSVKSGDEGWSL